MTEWKRAAAESMGRVTEVRAALRTAGVPLGGEQGDREGYALCNPLGDVVVVDICARSVSGAWLTDAEVASLYGVAETAAKSAGYVTAWKRGQLECRKVAADRAA